MLDFKKYIFMLLQNDAQKNIILKYFGKIEFSNLHDSISFFKNIEKKIDFIESRQDKEALIQISLELVKSLEGRGVDYLEFLNTQIYPKLNLLQILGDLNPINKSGTISLECPLCKNEKKKTITNGNRNAFVVKTAGRQTGIIKCNRINNCVSRGEGQSIIKYVMNRDGTTFRDCIIILSNSVGVDFLAMEKSQEIHKEDGNLTPEHQKTFQEKIAAPIQKYKKNSEFTKIDFKVPDRTKNFQSNIDLSRLKDEYKKLSMAHRLQIVYSYIKEFTLKEIDKRGMHSYFKFRGLNFEQTEDVGVLKASKISKLLDELIKEFGEEDLILFGIISEKYKTWKYLLVDRDNKYKTCDSAVFFMHDIYSNIPTNIEFKFFGDITKGAKVKAASMAQSNLLDSNYYGSSNNIDFIKNNTQHTLWWTESVMDAKTLTQFGIKVNSLIGAGKHFNKNIGYFNNKISIIAFDEDIAGIQNSEKFAKKLKMANTKHIFIAAWDAKYGKDVNELLQNKNLDKIKLSYVVFNKERENEPISYDISEIRLVNFNT